MTSTGKNTGTVGCGEKRGREVDDLAPPLAPPSLEKEDKNKKAPSDKTEEHKKESGKDKEQNKKPVAVPPDQIRKKGFFGKLFDKEEGKKDSSVDDEIARLRQELGVGGQAQNSIQAQFEEQVAQENKDKNIPPPQPEGNELSGGLEKQTEFPSVTTELEESAPMPPPETLEGNDPQVPQEDQTLETQDETMSVEEHLPADEDITPIHEQTSAEEIGLDDLESALKEITEVKKKSTVSFKLPNKKPVRTLAELKKAIEKMAPSTFKKHAEKKDFGTWVRNELFNEGLAQDFDGLLQRKRMIELIDAELGEIYDLDLPKEPQVPKHKEVEHHFVKLNEEHKKTMKELEDLVSSRKVDSLSKRTLKKHFLLENKKLVESLKELVHAIEIIDEETYNKVVTKNKDELKEWVSELAKKAAKAGRLNAEKLQAELVDQIRLHSVDIENKMEMLKNDIKREAELLVDHEHDLNLLLDKISESKTQLEVQKTNVQDQEEHLQELREEVREEKHEYNRRQMQISRQLEQKLKDIKRAQAQYETSVAKQKERLEKHEKNVKEQLSALKEEQQAKLKAREQAVKKKELEIPIKIREESLELVKEREELKKLRAELQQREKVLLEKEEEAHRRYDEMDEELEERESMIQKSIERLMNLDEDAKNLREEAEKIKREADDKGFKNYLDDRLKTVRPEKPFEHLDPKRELRKTYSDVYSKIDDCNQAIENKDFEKAKEIYKELKNLYEEGELLDEAKNILYDAIREIYTNLHLAMLEN